MGKWLIKSPESYNMMMGMIQAKFDQISEAVPVTTTQALKDVALDCLGRSVNRAPNDTGDLRGSGYAEVNGNRVAEGLAGGGAITAGEPGEPRDGTIEAKIGFSSKYAMVQHEHMEFNHPSLARQKKGDVIRPGGAGQAKFLESVVRENQQKHIQMLRDAARAAFGGG